MIILTGILTWCLARVLKTRVVLPIRYLIEGIFEISHVVQNHMHQQYRYKLNIQNSYIQTNIILLLYLSHHSFIFIENLLNLFLYVFIHSY